MSISLNNHESRIKALENGGAGSWSKGSNANGNWVKESKTGLLIQFFTTPSDTKTTSIIKLPISFSNSNYIVSGIRTQISHEAVPSISSKSNDSITIGFWGSGSWSISSKCDLIAIGYLISYRILNYAYACKSLLFTPLRTTGGVK